MNDVTRILILEERSSDFALAQTEIGKALHDCRFARAEDRSSFLKSLADFRPDLILSADSLLSLPGSSVLELAKQHAPLTPLIIWGESLDEDILVKWIKAGAANCVSKRNLQRLVPAVLRALEERPRSECRDVTELQREVAALRSRERDLRMITEDMHELICRFQPDGTLTYVNQVYCDYYGKTQQELLGTNFLREAQFDFAHKLSEHFRSLSPENPVKTFEQYDVLPSGQKRWREWVDRGIFDGKGALVEIQSTGRDITARKQIEEKYQDIFENSPVGIFQSTPAGQYLNMNPALAHIYGYSSPQEMMENIQDIASQIYADPGERERFKRILQAHDSIKEFEFRNRRKDGSIFWTSTSARTVRDAQGNILYYEGFLRDISASKEAEEALRQSQARYHDLFESSPISLWEEDYSLLKKRLEALQQSGVKNIDAYLSSHPEVLFELTTLVKVTDVNRASLEIYHAKQKEDLLKNLSELFVEETLEHFRSEILGLMSPAARFSWEGKDQTLDGEPIIIMVEGSIAPGCEEDWSKIIVSIVDITERKRAEEALRLAEQKYRSLVERLPVVVYTAELGKSGAWHYVSPQIEQLLGFTAEEWMADSSLWYQQIHPEDRDQEEVLEEQAYRRGESFVGEYRMFTRDGTMLWIRDSAQISPDANGGAPLLQGIMMDINERKQAEQALHESESKAKALLNALPDLMFRLDRHGTLLDYKADITDLYAQSEPTLIHRKIREFSPPEFADLIDRYIQMTLANGEMQVFEYQLPVPGRGIRSYEARMVPSGSEEVTAVVRDITERKQAEEALRESEERFSKAFEYAPIGMGMALPNGRFLKVNQVLCELLGYSEQELRNKTFQELTHPQDLEEDLNYVEKLLAGELFSYQLEKRYLHKAGHIVWVLLSVSLARDAEGNPQYFLGQLQDITEPRRAEEEIRRRVNETTALLETSLALTNLDSNAILQTIGSSAQNLFDADGCRIFLIEPDGESLRCVLALQEDFVAFSDLKLRMGEGVTGAVAVSGQAEIVNEMQKDPRSVVVPGTSDEEEEAVMFAPLKERDRTIGVLSIRRAGSARPFTPADLELLEAFAAMAASAVSNARLFEEAQRRLSELEALYENGLAVGQLREPREIGERVIETFARYLSWHHVTIRLLDPETNQLDLIAFNLPGLDDEEALEAERHFKQLINKPGQGLSGQAVETGLPIRTGDVHVHSEYVDTQDGIESGLYMPMKIRDRVIGVISVESEKPDAFTEQDERLLATLASQAAVAFENARLYQAAHEELLERTRAQAALWASETHYRELADSITDVLFELDHNLRLTHWNKASEMLTSIPQEDAIGKSMYEIFGESEEQLQLGTLYEQVLVTRQAKMFETKFLLKDKRLIFEVNVYPSTRGVSVVAQNITERKLDEALLQKRFELMEYSAHHSLDELMQKMIDEVGELTDSHVGFLHFVEENQQMINIQAWSSETRQKLGDIAAQGTYQPLVGIWAEALRERRPIIRNDDASRSNTQGFPHDRLNIVREVVIPILRDEKTVAVLGIGNKPQEYTQHDIEIATRFADYAWDITERKRMESILADERNQLARRVEERTADLSRANSNLARALRVKDEFLANMSHELRTPLNAILGLSESLGEQVAGPLNEKQQKYLNTINESGHHLLSLINDILDLAKIEAGQITLDINKVDVNSVCQASLRMIKQLAQKKDQQVEFEIDDDIGLMWADERRLKQMLVNLLSNAVKFTPQSGRLGLEVHGDRAGNRVSLTVWDKGIGISEQDMERLFKPFVQLDSGLARETTGTGLGLALVAQMARLHGGSVSAASKVGEGSRFSISLPWEPAIAADASLRLRNTGKFRAIDPNATEKPTVLIIEDTREVIMMLTDYLEMSGFRIVTAQDGTDGLLQAKLSHPNLILMDIMMPGMDGFETTRRLRMDPEFRDTPIIALTALAMPNDRKRCLDAGMDEYISKPVNMRALTKLMQNILLDKEGKPR